MVQQPKLTSENGYPICADFGSAPITTLAVQIWAFCASTGRADGIAGYNLG
jgi:hypothetical protein